MCAMMPYIKSSLPGIEPGTSSLSDEACTTRPSGCVVSALIFTYINVCVTPHDVITYDALMTTVTPHPDYVRHIMTLNADAVFLDADFSHGRLPQRSTQFARSSTIA